MKKIKHEKEDDTGNIIGASIIGGIFLIIFAIVGYGDGNKFIENNLSGFFILIAAVYIILEYALIKWQKKEIGDSFLGFLMANIIIFASSILITFILIFIAIGGYKSGVWLIQNYPLIAVAIVAIILLKYAVYKRFIEDKK